MTRKTRIKAWIIIFVICMTWFSDWAFAADDSLEWITWLVNYIITFLSWWWVLFAKLAGTFLTNHRVFGEAIWLDILLRKYWNVMKNLANFWLWFYFMFVILKWLVNNGKWSITKNIKNIILWILIAWVWIQVSRFFTAAVVDVSTITLTAAAAFPSQVMADNPDTDEAIKKSLSDYLDPSFERVTKWKEISFLPVDNAASSYLKTLNVELEEPQTIENLVDAVMPNANDVSWPLYFMWYSILETNIITSIDSSSERWFKATILNSIIQWGTTIVYAVEMLILCVLALMRIIYLWMFIVMSPIAILIRCIEKSWQKISWNSDKWFLGSFTKQINLTSFFINVFRPTIVVLGLWIAVLFASLMKKVIVDNGTREFDMWWVTVSSTKDNTSNTQWSEWDQTYTTTVDAGVVHFTLAHAWKTFLQIILSIITVLVVYLIIQMAVKMWNWKDFVSEKIGKLQDTIWWAITSLPVVPVAWFDNQWQAKTRYISAGKALGVDLRWGLNFTWEWLVNRKLMKMNEAQKLEISKQADAVSELWWSNWDNLLSESDRTQLKSAGSTLNWELKLKAKKDFIFKKKTESWLWMFLDPTLARDNNAWIDEFTGWLNWLAEEPTWERNWIMWAWNRLWENKTLEGLFTGEGKKYVRVYADYFELWDDVTDWNSLKIKDISKK